MSIRMSFVLYALFSLLIGIIICIFLISMVDRYRINLNYKYENMSTRYDIPENGSFTATYSYDQTKYTIFDTKGNEICKFNVDYQKERPVHEYVYPNHVSYIEVLPNFTSRDRLIDSALGSLNIAIIPIVLSISMICCVTFFYKKKLSSPPFRFCCMSSMQHDVLEGDGKKLPFLWCVGSMQITLSRPSQKDRP